MNYIARNAGVVMCPKYYTLRAKLESLYTTGKAIDVMAAKEIRLAMSEHIQECVTCGANWEWLKERARNA